MSPVAAEQHTELTARAGLARYPDSDGNSRMALSRRDWGLPGRLFVMSDLGLFLLSKIGIGARVSCSGTGEGCRPNIGGWD